jgi:uncharacterized protein
VPNDDVTTVTKRPRPVVDDDSRGFWDAIQQRRVDVQCCAECARHVFYPRALCTTCGRELSWRTVSGRATVYSYTVSRRPAGPAFEAAVPYVVALVDLEEGARMLTTLVGVAPEGVHIGMPVQADFEVGDDFVFLVFRPVGGTS